MTADQLLTDLAVAGINLAVVDGKLTFDAPQDAVTDALMACMRSNRAELIEALSRPAKTSTVCPWCRSADLIDHAQGMECNACGKLAWLLGPDGSLTRCDVPDFAEYPPEDQPVCRCGRSMQSLDYKDVWHCETCEPERRRRTLRVINRVKEQHQRQKATRQTPRPASVRRWARSPAPSAAAPATRDSGGAPAQQAPRLSCWPHNRPEDYIDRPVPNRPGWIRSTCRICQKFVGYREDNGTSPDLLAAMRAAPQATEAAIPCDRQETMGFQDG